MQTGILIGRVLHEYPLTYRVNVYVKRAALEALYLGLVKEFSTRVWAFLKNETER